MRYTYPPPPRKTSIKPYNNTAKIAAFTLVEMSIVLIIIGLIVTGIAKGADMIRSGKIMSITTQIEGYKAAVNVFDLKYDALPGDMINAWDYWGANCNNNTDWCNGDGDGVVRQNWNPPVHQNEGLTFWQHLSLAGLIKGEYPGRRVSSLWSDIGITIPKTTIDGVGVEIYNRKSFGRTGTSMVVGSVLPSTIVMNKGAFTPAEAAQIDKKIDDGQADGGSVRPTYNSVTGKTTDCTGGANPNTASSGSYDLSVVDRPCVLLFFF